MARINKVFHNEDRALGFADGIIYANDSSCSVLGISFHEGMWWVTISDEDTDEDVPMGDLQLNYDVDVDIT